MSTVDLLDVRPAGGEALLVTVADHPSATSLAAHLRAEPLTGQRDLTPAARTVLIHARGGTNLREFAAELADREVPLLEGSPGKVVTMDVVYDGDDLARVAELTSLSASEIIALHAGAEWTAGFAGFAPGFFYLTTSSPFPRVPRRESPRTSVPAGSVALAGEFSAVYPRESPGGWQLVGRTDARLFDLNRDPVTLVEPGDVIRFNAVRELLSVSPVPGAAPPPVAAGTPSLTVIAPGTFSSIQDSGRGGHSEIGVGAAGFADRAAARRANRLVGNAKGAACIELIGGGFVVQAEADVILAVTGATTTMVVFDEESDLREPESGKPFSLYAGESLEIDFPEAGLRNYLAVRGGFDTGEVLGSQSTDTLSGIGPLRAPKRLGTGDELPISTEAPHSVGSFEPDLVPVADAEVEIRFRWGPRDDWFAPEARDALVNTVWTISPQSNRVGLRLDGGTLDRDEQHTGELVSEGVVLGAIQVPASGQPIIFHVDHPVTGGYPVIGVVERQDIDKAAQLPPGTAIRFVARD